MSRNFGFAAAVPQRALLESLNQASPTLLIERRSAWTHLKTYLAQAAQLTAGPHAQLANAAQAVASHARLFGTPAQLRALVVAEPAALAQPEPPALLYGALVWLVLRMQRGASSVCHHTHALTAGAMAASERREVLKMLGEAANTVLVSMPATLHSLRQWSGTMVALNDALALAAAAAGSELQHRQQALGRAQGQLAMLERELAQLGIFSHRKKHELQAQIAALRAPEARDKALTEELRLQVHLVEQVVAHGGWVATALMELVQWLDSLRAGWGEFGSGTTQMAVDAPDANLAGCTWLARALSADVVLPMWQALAQACQAFADNAFVDWPLPPCGKGELA